MCLVGYAISAMHRNVVMLQHTRWSRVLYPQALGTSYFPMKLGGLCKKWKGGGNRAVTGTWAELMNEYRVSKETFKRFAQVMQIEGTIVWSR